MTDRELDAAIAEKVMGWRQSTKQNDRGQEYEVWVLPNGATVPVGNSWPQHYSTDRNAAALVLVRIGELGLQDNLCRALIPLLPKEGCEQLTYTTSWAILSATPRQLMEAALAAVEGDK